MSKSTLFVQLFAGLVLIATGVHASCPIELSPASVVVKYGDPVLVNCSTPEIQFEGIGWEASQGGTGFEFVNHLPWTVERLTQWTVSPFCFFSSNYSNQCSKELDLIIYTFPETVTISGDPSSEMEEEKEYKFTCHIPNVAPVQNLTVRWYKGDTIIQTDTFDNPAKRPVDQTSDLKFTPTRQDNNALLRCEAYMDLSPDGPQLNISTQEYNITVVYGPDILCPTTDILEEQTLEEICMVTGNPTPHVRWLKDGEPVNPTVPLTRDNAGIYTLEAQGLSTVQKTIPVLVLYGPELTCPLTYTAVEYSPHNLTCTDKGFPKPETLWFKDGEEVVLPQKLTRSDAGQYFVTTSNLLSSVNVTVDITVLYPPSPIVELEDSEVHVGSSVWLKCSSMGNPRPKYSWNYYQAANVVETDEDGVSRLLIHNATVYNMGSYTCEAWNDIGNVTKTVHVNVKGAKLECPIRITPDTMVMQYKSKTQNATCTPTSDSFANVNKIFWQDLQGKRTDSTVWFADTHKDWNESPVCYANFQGIGTCHKTLNFILYKTPDSVTIYHLDNSSSVVENRELQLQCDIINVAPAQNLRIHWYRGNETLKSGSVQMTRCWTDNDTNCDISMIRSPVNVSSTISITLNRNHSGADFRCEAQLDLGPGGPEPSPNMMSSPLNITVFYKPTINTTKLPKTIPVFRGYPEELVCEADGHPPPRIQWLYSSDKAPHELEGKLIVSEAGLYNCTATNDVDSTVHVVVVILKEDYLPLIAGFVAVTVVAISIVFLFIYSIYYKNTKMRRYSLKNPKLSTHHGNVAHNGWDLPLPMTKLS
ncbi:hemicentin-1 [Amphiprion ocellaris]|uniref:Ig-like domain-containing protein n=1 Tax=Amphiprion ocellaris TaxID=80972 RepID=A0A3Q1C0W9_AMPOC|nr:hemicentin-1 [Amphiprion ocellaris]